MQYSTITMYGVVVLLIAPLPAGLPGLSAAESADRLPPEAMAGQVVDPAGKPAVGVAVCLVGGPHDEDAKTLDTTVTDSEGRFVFLRAASTRIGSETRRPHLVARDAQGRLGGEPMPWEWVSMRYLPRHDLRIELADVQDYQGRLTDVAGNPIAKATICPLSVAPEPFDDPARRGVQLPLELCADLRTETDIDGTFTLRRVPVGGSVVSRITAPGFGSARVMWNLLSSATLQLGRVGNIRGVLVAPPGATALDTLKLSLYSASDPQQTKDTGFRVFDTADTQPDRDGRFQFENVSPGSARIYLNLHDSSLPYYSDESISVTVKPGETTALEVGLLQAVAVRGQVVDTESGKGIAGVVITVNMVSDQGYLQPRRRTTTDSEGGFLAYTQPGKVALNPENVPEGYVVPRRQGELLKMDAVEDDITWPTIKLERAAQLQAIVVDQSGQPVPDAEVQYLVPLDGHALNIQRTDGDGACAMGGLNSNEFVALRARTKTRSAGSESVSTAVSDVIQIRPADAKGPVRLVLSPANVFAIRGQCVDAAGGPIPQAKVTIGTSWMLGPSGLGFSVTSCDTDAEGRFESSALWPGFQYHVSASAEGYDEFESKRFPSEPGEVHDVGRLTLVATGGYVEGIVIDSSGQPIAGARVFNSGDAPKPLATQTDPTGQFRLEGFRMGPVIVFADKTGHRFTGVRTEANSTGVKIELLRGDEPVARWEPQRPPLALADGQRLARRILEKLWATPPHGRKSWTIEYMARIDAQQAMKWSTELGGRYDDVVRRVAAERSDVADTEEVLALVTGQEDRRAYFTLQLLANRCATSDPPRALRLAEEMIQRARRLDQPDRTLSLAAAGALVLRLGKTEAGRTLVEEAADMAASMGTDGRQGYVRGRVATALAPLDLARATSLVEPVSEKHVRESALARMAMALASQDLDKALEIIGRLDKRSTLPDLARMQVAYELIPTRRDDAMRVVEGMDSHAAVKTKAEALGWLAKAVAPRDQQFAHGLIDKSMAIYWGQPEEFRGWSSWGGRTAMAAFVVSQASEIGYPDMGLLLNRVLAMRPSGTDVWSPRDSQQAAIRTAGILAMVDPECARQVLLSAVPQQPATEGALSAMENLELLQAWALIDGDYAVTLIESRVDAAEGNDFGAGNLISVLDLLTTSPDQRAEVLLRLGGGRWFPGTEL